MECLLHSYSNGMTPFHSLSKEICAHYRDWLTFSQVRYGDSLTLSQAGYRDSVTFSQLLIVKLHSDLRILTQLQLVGVGVDFVFPLEGRKKKEGRKDGTTLT